MTDTDSLSYEIKTPDFYEDIKNDISKWFDTSNYSKDHSSGIPTGVNKNDNGMMKVEAGGRIITEFAGLRSKFYAWKVQKHENMCRDKTCDGNCNNVIKNLIVIKNAME